VLNLRHLIGITALSMTIASRAVRADMPLVPQLPTQGTAAQAPVELPVAVPAGNKLTIVQAVQTGLKDNPQTTASHFAVVSARENYNSQKSPINPTIQYGALNNTVAPATITDGISQPSNYTAYVTLETSGARRYRASQSREQFHQAEFDALAANQGLKLGILYAYVNVQVANRTLEVEQRVYANMVELAELTRKRFEAGAGTEADSIRANISAIQEQQNLIVDVAAVNTARATLNQQIGHPAEAPIDSSTPLEFNPVPVPDSARLLSVAEKNRPELQSAAANLKSLVAATGLARSAYFPDLILGKDFTGTGEINMGLSVPLDLGSIKGSVRKARADVKGQEAQLEVARQGVALDVKTAQINLLAAKKQVDTYETGILKQSETLYDRMRQSYVLGANTLLDVITAEITYRSVQSAYYSAVGAYRQALYTLEHAIAAPLNAAPGGALSLTPEAPMRSRK